MGEYSGRQAGFLGSTGAFLRHLVDRSPHHGYGVIPVRESSQTWELSFPKSAGTSEALLRVERYRREGPNAWGQRSAVATGVRPLVQTDAPVLATRPCFGCY